MEDEALQIFRSLAHALSVVRGKGYLTSEDDYLIESGQRLLSYLSVQAEDLPGARVTQQEALTAVLDGPDPQSFVSENQLGDLVLEGYAQLEDQIRSRTPGREQSKLVAALALPLTTSADGVRERMERLTKTNHDAPARLDLDRVNAYMASREMPAGVGSIGSIEYITGGYSRETILLNPTDGDPIVIRKAIDGDDASRLFPEFKVLQFAHDNGIPTPTPLWIESNQSCLGNSFFAVGKVAGSNKGNVFGSEAPISPLLVGKLARILAKLHRIDISGLEEAPNASLADKQLIMTTLDKLAEQSADPLYQALISWLRVNIPPLPPRVSLLHGDVGFHNVMCDGDEVTAVLDWEAAHIGDPAEELAYVRPSLEPHVPWAEFLGQYIEAGGSMPSVEALKFYTVYQNVWRAGACMVRKNIFMTEPTPRLAFGIPGFIFGPQFLLEAARGAFTPD